MKKHVENCDAHEEVIRLSKLADMGVEDYTQEVLETTPIGGGIKKMMSPNDKITMTIKFNMAYYLAKKERPFSDFEDLLALQGKNGLSNKITKAYRNDSSTMLLLWGHSNKRPPLEYDVIVLRYVSRVNSRGKTLKLVRRVLFSWITLKKV